MLATQVDPGRLEGTAYLWTMPDGECPDASASRRATHSGAGRLLARLALSHCCQVQPQDWRLGRDARGKPFIVAPTAHRAIGISMSHTDGLVACLLSGHGTAAVDVERIRPWDDLPFLAPQILSTSEQCSLAGLDGEAWLRRFFEYWTLKEAYAKALGVGLACDLSSVSFDLAPGCDVTARFADGVNDVASDWIFRRLPLGPEWTGAVAVKAGSLKISRLVHTELMPDMLTRELSRMF